MSLDLYGGQLQTLAYVGLAMLLGAIIGLERELEDKPAGLRTHMLVGGAAALFVALADIVVGSLSAQLGSDLVRSDPVRIIEAVVTGVSFLGAGTIVLRRRERQVEGLTTAASILFTAAVGVCVEVNCPSALEDPLGSIGCFTGVCNEPVATCCGGSLLGCM